jgi:hypothetical protein
MLLRQQITLLSSASFNSFSLPTGGEEEEEEEEEEKNCNKVGNVG